MNLRARPSFVFLSPPLRIPCCLLLPSPNCSCSEALPLLSPDCCRASERRRLVAVYGKVDTPETICSRADNSYESFTKPTQATNRLQKQWARSEIGLASLRSCPRAALVHPPFLLLHRCS